MRTCTRGHLFPRNPLRPSDGDVSLAREAEVLSLSYPPGAVSPSSFSPLPLIPLRSYQRRILPCSTCLSRVQDGVEEAEWRRKRAARSQATSAERIYEGQRSVSGKGSAEKKREEFRGTCSVIIAEVATPASLTARSTAK